MRRVNRDAARMGDLIRTGAAATILGTSRQHIVDLVERGVLANYGQGVQRRVDRGEVEVLAGRRRPTDERLNLWIHQAVAGRIVRAPLRSMADARRRYGALALEATSTGRSLKWLLRWRRLLADGPEVVVRAITAESDVGDALRHESPVIVLLSEAELSRLRRTFLIADRWRPRRWRERERAKPRRPTWPWPHPGEPQGQGADPAPVAPPHHSDAMHTAAVGFAGRPAGIERPPGT